VSQNNNDLQKATKYNFTVRVADIIYYDLNPVHLDDKGNVRVEFYLSIVNNVLAFNKDASSSSYYCDLKIDLSVFSESGEFLTRYLWDEKIRFSESEFDKEKTNETQLQKDFSLATGSYQIKVSLLDGTTNRSKVFESDLLVKAASENAEYITEPKFYLADKYQSNQKVLNFNQDYNVGFYYKGTKGFDLELQILNKHRKLLVVERKRLRKADQLERAFVKLRTSELKEGRYILQLVYNNRAIQQTEFEILWWKKPMMLNEMEFAFRPFKLLLIPNEIETFEGLTPAQKLQFFHNFWNEKAKTQQNGFNPLLTEFYRRVDYALMHYSFRKELGYKTDLGKTYILQGAPIREERILLKSKQVIIWFYENFKTYFTFNDRLGSYVLSNELGAEK
jgi:GWxTD domain-containing protein